MGEFVHSSPAKMRKSRPDKEQEPLQQIPDLSFNISGRAFRQPPEFDPETPLFLNAKSPSSALYKVAMKKGQKATQAQSRVAFSLTEEELLEEPPTGLCRYLLVGCVPQNAPKEQKVATGKRNYGDVVGI